MYLCNLEKLKNLKKILFFLLQSWWKLKITTYLDIFEITSICYDSFFSGYVASNNILADSCSVSTIYNTVCFHCFTKLQSTTPIDLDQYKHRTFDYTNFMVLWPHRHCNSDRNRTILQLSSLVVSLDSKKSFSKLY